VTDAGGGAAMRFGERMHLGVQVVGTHLELEGAGSRFVDGHEVLRMGTSSGSTRFVAIVGGLLELNRSLAIGASVMSGTKFTADRTALNPSLPLTLDAGSDYDVVRPLRASGGFSWSVSPRLRLVGQVDYVAYGSIRDGVTLTDGGGPSALELDNALEPRGGLELSIPFRNTGSLQLRAGAHSRAPGSLVFKGADATTAATFPGGERELEPAAGATLIVSSFAFHAAYTGGQTPLFAFGGTLKF
jgi:hypothetical protein